MKQLLSMFQRTSCTPRNLITPRVNQLPEESLLTLEMLLGSPRGFDQIDPYLFEVRFFFFFMTDLFPIYSKLFIPYININISIVFGLFLLLLFLFSYCQHEDDFRYILCICALMEYILFLVLFP